MFGVGDAFARVCIIRYSNYFNPSILICMNDAPTLLWYVWNFVSLTGIKSFDLYYTICAEPRTMRSVCQSRALEYLSMSRIVPQ